MILPGYPFDRKKIIDSVSEKDKNACVAKDKTCKVVDDKMFNSNMNKTLEYMKKVFKGGKLIHKIAYIDFSNNTGVINYPYKTIPGKQKIKHTSY